MKIEKTKSSYICNIEHESIFLQRLDGHRHLEGLVDVDWRQCDVTISYFMCEGHQPSDLNKATKTSMTRPRHKYSSKDVKP